MVLMLMTAAVAVASYWSPSVGHAGLWRFPAALLLLGLAYESWVVAHSGVTCGFEPPEHFFLGRDGTVRFVLEHGLRRNLDVEFAPSAPEYSAR